MEKFSRHRRMSVIQQHEKAHPNIAFSRCHDNPKRQRGPINTGLSAQRSLPGSSHLGSTLTGRCRGGELACHTRATGVPHRGSDVLQHSARAVVPPPRLRAKWVVFSAYLRTIPRSPGCGSALRSGGVKTLRNPAKVGRFRKAHKCAWAAGFSWCLGKRVRFFLSGVCLAGGPVFTGLET